MTAAHDALTWVLVELMRMPTAADCAREGTLV